MRNEVWSEIGTFLNGLRCGNVKRESYIQLSEVAEAEEQKKDIQVELDRVIQELKRKDTDTYRDSHACRRQYTLD